MRINGFGTGSVEERERVKAEPNATGSAGQAPASGVTPPAGESVVVSPETQKLSAAVSRGDAVRSQRVASVRAAVESGTYVIDRGKLAEKIADDELERSGRR